MVYRVIHPDQFIEHAKAHWISMALDSIATRGRFEVALSGGTTPASLYQRLAASAELAPHWDKMRLWFGDERCVPPTDAQSNFLMSQDAGLRPALGLTLERMEGELDPAQAARNYALRLEQLPLEQGWPRLDLVMLGMGDDGHVASLFPGSANLAERRQWVKAAHIDDDTGWRISLTMPVIAAARQILVLVRGAAKAPVLAQALADAREGRSPSYPASEITALPQAIWLVDEAAAQGVAS